MFLQRWSHSDFTLYVQKYTNAEMKPFKRYHLCMHHEMRYISHEQMWILTECMNMLHHARVTQGAVRE